MKWPMVRLDEVTDKVKSWNPLKSSDAESFLYIDLSSVDKESKKIDEALVAKVFPLEAPSRARQLVQENDVIVATVRPNLNGVAFIESKYDGSTASTGYCVLRPKENTLYSKYLFYWVQTDLFIADMMSKATGANYPAVSDRIIKDSKIPLPPLEEQKRIAAILDKADAIRRKRQQTIQLADEFLRSVFLDMFGDPVTNPKGWEVKPVGEVCRCIVPGHDKPKSFTGSTPWITTNELNHLGVTTKQERFIGLSEEEIAEVKAKVVPKGSVLMTCVGDLGVVSIAGDDMVINQQLHAFLSSDFVTPSFLSYTLAWQKEYMVRMASSTTVPYMNKTVCNSIPVILPPTSLQARFEKIVEKVAESKAVMAGASSAGLFESISQRSFSGEL